MSDHRTPLTDVLLSSINEGREYEDIGPLAELCRTLERELSAATARIAAVQGDLDVLATVVRTGYAPSSEREWTDDIFRRTALVAIEQRELTQKAEARIAEMEKEEPRETLASRLIDAWCADKGKQIPWAKAIQIVAIVTKQSNDERDRLLRLGDEDGACEMCGRHDPVAAPSPDVSER